jgi:Fe-S cluster assembly iron-binding protein IscA
MLTCTPAAAASLEEVRKQNLYPDELGVRIFPAQSPEGEVGLGIDFAQPAEGDRVTEQHGTTLIVDPELDEQLAELTLDVVPDPSGNGNASPQLVLRPREEA